MTEKNDGGQAFPAMAAAENGYSYVEGMTLRDWFAGMALSGLAGHMHQWSNEDRAKRAYRDADAMLRARGE